MKKFVILFLLLFILSISILSSQCNFSTDSILVGSEGPCVISAKTYILPIRTDVCVSGIRLENCFNEYNDKVKKTIIFYDIYCNTGVKMILEEELTGNSYPRAIFSGFCE